MPPKKTKTPATATPAAAAAAAATGPTANANSNSKAAAETPEVLPQGIADMEVPKSTVTRLAKSALPDDSKMAKEVPVALVRASTVFISYLAALSQETAASRNNKTINAQHVLDSIKELGWPESEALQKHLKSQLKAYKANAAAKKEGKPLPYPKADHDSKPSKPRSKATAKAAAASSSATTSGAATAGADDGQEDVEMQDAHGRSGPEEEQEEDIDEGDIPDDEAGEEEDEVADAFSEPEDADHQDAKPDNAASNGEPQDL